jgi:hypothetical protein
MGAPIEPTEADIRAACEEAGIIAGDAEGNAWRAVTALARRIAAEREAVVVAWMYERNGKARVSFGERSEDMLPAWTEMPLYAHPPKEPTI